MTEEQKIQMQEILFRYYNLLKELHKEGNKNSLQEAHQSLIDLETVIETIWGGGSTDR